MVGAGTQRVTTSQRGHHEPNVACQVCGIWKVRQRIVDAVKGHGVPQVLAELQAHVSTRVVAVLAVPSLFNITQFADVCGEVRARAAAASDAAGALFTNRMQKSRRNGKKTKVHTSCGSAAKQDSKRGRNVSGAEMFQKGLAQLCAQSGRCALTGIVFEEERGPFQASLDAVDPSKAHAEEGNLRWVCLFMNRIDRLRDRTYVSNGSSAWTPDRMKTYFGLSL